MKINRDYPICVAVKRTKKISRWKSSMEEFEYKETDNSESKNAEAAGETDSVEADDVAFEVNKILEKTVRGLKKWQKRLLIFSGIVTVIMGSLFFVFLYMSARGEKGMKTEVDDSGRIEGHFIVYNGKEYRYKEDVINILCMGIDKHNSMSEERAPGVFGFADANYLLSIDTKAGTVKIIAISRDTMLEVKAVDDDGNVVGTKEMQLCYQYCYGKTMKQSSELSVEAVSKLFYLLPIQRYCAVNMEAIPVINDAVGGVDITVLEDVVLKDMMDEKTGEPRKLKKGEKLHLEGQLALEYIRERDQNISGSNLRRIERQKQYITEFYKQGKEKIAKDLTIPVKVFEELKDKMSTNLTTDDITYLVPELLNMSVDVDDIQMVPGEQIKGEYVEYYVDQEALKKMVIENFYEEVSE